MPEIHTDGATATAEETGIAQPPEEPVVADAEATTDDARPAPWPPSGAALARIGAAAALTLAATAVLARKSASGPPLERGESLALSVRPRKVVKSYLRSAGLWELDRRATRFTVTDRRLLVEEGLFRRAVTAVPLSVLQHVVVRTGPWQGWVDVSFPTSTGRGVERMGPFRSPVAREFAATIGRRGGVAVDAVEEE